MIHIPAPKYRAGLTIENSYPAAGSQNVIMPEVMLPELHLFISIEHRIIFKATAWTG